ncbi:Acid phosphatase 1, partial [Linum perenne]
LLLLCTAFSGSSPKQEYSVPIKALLLPTISFPFSSISSLLFILFPHLLHLHYSTPDSNIQSTNQMTPFFLLISFLSASSLVAADLTISHHLPRPLIVEYHRASGEDLNPNLRCESWRIAGEANNLNPWATIPNECLDYVRSYVTGRAYVSDLEIVSTEAAAFAERFKLRNDGKDVWVFDIDETLLSNLPYYAQHGYGGEVFDSVAFDNWVDEAAAPALEPSLKLYQQLLELGFRIILLTGRSEAQRNVTERNLRVAGFQRWDRLILRGVEDHGKLATIYKSEKRTWMLEQGYRIVGNSGDQWSDLLGCPISNRSFKIPNPMYYIA